MNNEQVHTKKFEPKSNPNNDVETVLVHLERL